MPIEFDGLEEVMESLTELASPEAAMTALGKACALVEGAARKKAPKGNGALARSIVSKVEEQNGSVVGVVFTPLEYAPYVEYGTGLFAEDGGRTDVPWCYQDDEGNWHTTSGQKPQPFLRPALDENREKIIRILREGLTK